MSNGQYVYNMEDLVNVVYGDLVSKKRFTIKLQDDYFGLTDNLTEDKVNVVNGIRTEIEAKWLCDLLNDLHEEKEMWKRECKRWKGLYYLENENVELEDIIGLVKTDEPTNSVELKKELYK